MPTPTPNTAAVTVCRVLSPELCLCDMLMMPSRLRLVDEISRSRNRSLSTYARRLQPKPFPRLPLAKFARIQMQSYPWLKRRRPPVPRGPLLCLDAEREMPREYFQSAALG